MSGFVGDDDNMGDNLNQFLAIAEKKPKKVKPRGSTQKAGKKARGRSHTSMSTDTGLSTVSSKSESESDSEAEHSAVFKKKRKTKGKSGILTKSGNSCIIADQIFTHSALEDVATRDCEFADLSFNLLVAGELEIISGQNIGSKERETRMQVLKKLAYKSEFLPLKDILALYAIYIK